MRLQSIVAGRVNDSNGCSRLSPIADPDHHFGFSMAGAWIALGGNTGDVVSTMQAALQSLHDDARLKVKAISSVYETAPVGPDAGERYLNAAAGLETSASAPELLNLLKNTEAALGRRAAERWTARVIDLDLLLVGNQIVDGPQLTLPHPHLWYRRFVLDPLREIAADVRHPVFDETIGELHAALEERPLHVCVLGGCAEDRMAVGALLRRRGFALETPDDSAQGPLRIRFVRGRKGPEPAASREVDLSGLPGGIVAAVESVVAAVLDQPQVYSRPLRRMP